MTNIAAAVLTTFPNSSWNVYSKSMLQSFAKYWPAEIPLLVQLDDNLLEDDVKKIIRPQDGLVCGWTKDHAEFVERNKDKDHATDYRKQAVRFCHKVFALKFALDSAQQARDAKAEDAPRYLIWMDADVITNKPVTYDDIAKCLPKEGDAVAYLGRKDWDHSECGWLAFDLSQESATQIVHSIEEEYIHDKLFELDQWHDSFVFDYAIRPEVIQKTNLTDGKPGRDIWALSPMAAWSEHHKGPVAKNELFKEGSGIEGLKVNHGDKSVPLRIQTRNSVANPLIQQNILENQAQIKNWVTNCIPNNEEVVVVSGGPTLIAEDLSAEVAAGRKIFAVKHALEPLETAGIIPHACILLDPREHVADFVVNPDKRVIWYVASQVTPKAVKALLDAGCQVWGYHASVGADEDKLTIRQPKAIVAGGSATATRGLFLLEKLGFRNFRLYGYDLCLSNKPDLNEKDEQGQPKYFEVAIVAEKEHYKAKRGFWSKGELLAQYQEIVDIMNRQSWKITAHGYGIVPFLAEATRVSNLRLKAKQSKIEYSAPVTYEEMLGCKNKISLTRLRNMLPKIVHKQNLASN